ncbi:MAG: FAD-dependent monooxygenase, partial [Hymenobacteraceae bacterium]|nr:FAD-dependent monooxygenase [Hymenobacteraceae bacterium]
ALLARGHQVTAMQLRAGGRPVARVPLATGGTGQSPYPFLLAVSQDQTEAVVREALAARGIAVEWNTRLTALMPAATGTEVTVTLTRNALEAHTRYAYVVGCDGAHSAVRHAVEIEFPGDAYAATFFVADTELEGGLDPTALHVSLHPNRFYGFFPLVGGRTRIIGLLPPGIDPATATLADVQPDLEARKTLRIRRAGWFATYRVHHRVATQFRRGAVLLAGNAGHIHSPAGGQGMNTKMGDAVNLGWKLAAALRGTAPDAPALLATYEAERRPFAEWLVGSTDRAFTLATTTNPGVAWLRRFAGWCCPWHYACPPWPAARSGRCRRLALPTPIRP